MTWLIALSIVVTLAGIGLLVIGLRGRRIDDHPLCRACGFDLTGAPATSDRCPECGRATTRPRIGRRRRRAWPLAIGASLTMVVLLGGGTIGVGVARGVDWRDKLPTGWLLREATRGAVVDRADPIERLVLRDASSPLPIATRIALARAIIAVQPDATIAWQQTWGDWVAARIVDGTLPADARDAFVRELFADAIVDIRATVRRGNALPISIKVTRPRNRCTVAVPLDDVFALESRQLIVDGATMAASEHASNVSGFLSVISNLNFSEDESGWRAIAVGEHAVNWSCAIELRAKNGPPGAPILASVPIAWRGTVTIEDVSGDGGVRLVDDPKDLLRAAVQDVAIRMSTTNYSEMLDVRYAATLPSALAVDVFVRQDGGTERLLTRIARAASEKPGRCSYGGVGGGRLHPGVAQLILRASPTVARQTTDLTDIWRGELRIENVPVIDPTAKVATKPTTQR